MVHFNELRVSEDGTKLIIDASIDNLSYYDNMRIASIQIDTQDTYSPNGPSHNPIFAEICPQELNTKNIREVLSSRDLFNMSGKPACSSLNDTIFFVYITVEGILNGEPPCGMDNKTTMGIAFNLRPFYNNAMQYIKELNNDCTIPKNFINFILQHKAFKLALKTGNILEAIKYWKKFMKDTKPVSINNKCICNGNI